MAEVRFALLKPNGQPLTGAAPTVLACRGPAGQVLAPSAITEIGGGFYRFDVVAPAGGAYVVDVGAGAADRYLFGGFDPLVGFALLGADGAPAAGRAPTFLTYVDDAGLPLAQPAIADLGAGLYGFAPAAGTLPRYVLSDGLSSAWGVVEAGAGASVTVAEITPPPGKLSTGNLITFKVIDSTVPARRVLVALRRAGGFEIAFDGVNFDPAFADGSSRATVTGGTRFEIRRRGGWPGGEFSLEVLAVDPASQGG